jgi:hypothetical protein
VSFITRQLLTLLPDIAQRMHDPFAESAEIIVEGECRSDAEPLHKRKTGAIHEAESLVRILTEDGPRFCFVGRGDPHYGRRGLVQQPQSKLQGLLVGKSHAKEGDRFVNDQITGNEKSIREFYVLPRLMMQSIGLVSESKERRGVNEDGLTEQLGG